MSISPISAPAPIKPPDAIETKAPDVKPDADANDAGSAPKAAPAPLPPGQGTRVDQLV